MVSGTRRSDARNQATTVPFRMGPTARRLPGESLQVNATDWLMRVSRASQQVHGHVFDHGHVFGTETGAQSGEIVVEDHAQHPMEAIFDAPVSAHRAGEGLGAQAG
jgi:hypothetical protein